MSIILATALGPFAGIILSQHVDFKMIFLVTSLLAVIGFSMTFIVSEPTLKTPGHDRAAVKSFHISNYFEFKAVPISVIALIIGFSCSIVIAFISLYSRQIHLEEAASFYFLVSAIASFVSRPFAGRLFDVRGANYVIYPCLAIYALGMLLFSQAGHGMILLLAGAIIGVGYGNFMSCAQAISIKAALPHRFGLATATYYVFLDLGIATGPYLLGSLIPFTGYRGLYLMMAVLAAATIPLYYFLHGKRASAES